MCRWVAYQGPSIALEDILFLPGHSLIDQALNAREMTTPTNGDGFGFGWYAGRPRPGVFRDIMPIWNDVNARSIAHQVVSPLFFAHLRKSTGGAIQRTNCHPFAHERWLFMRNGSIPQFPRLKQRLYGEIDAGLFPHRVGSTDSECMFYLALTHGLAEDPPAGLRGMIGAVEAARRDAGIERPFRATVVVSDGTAIWALRYSSSDWQSTLYHSSSERALCDFAGCDTLLPPGSVIVASEPLGEVGEAWTPVEPTSLITVRGGTVSAEALGVG